MSLVLHIDQLIQTLFQNQTFQLKLKHFIDQQQYQEILLKQCKSIRTDVSDKLQLSQHSRNSHQIDGVVGQIQQILMEIYGKCYTGGGGDINIVRVNDNNNNNDVNNNNNKNYDDTGNDNDDLKNILAQIQKIKSSIQSISLQSQQNHQQLKILANTQKYVTIDQHNRWQDEILQKMDLVTKRNFHKVESMFADRLNSFQMNLIGRENRDKNKEKEKQVRKQKEESIVNNDGKQNQYKCADTNVKMNINPEQNQLKNVKKHKEKQDKTTLTPQSQLTKKLKSAKSLGSLFGFKK